MMCWFAKCSLPLLFCVAAYSCAPARKVDVVRSGVFTPSLAIADDPSEINFETYSAKADTMIVKDPEGKDLIIMKAVRDENGEMVASDVIRPSFVIASFRNVAERHGKVDLRFDINVPKELMDGEWQLRLSPLMEMLGENYELDPIFITGAGYRAAQLRGYERYQRFVDGIIKDSSLFINMSDLEIFLKRNLPGLYSFRSDSSFVSEENWMSAFGVSGADAVEHYTDHFRKRRNTRRSARCQEMYRRYVKSPIRTDAIRLDTIISNPGGDLVYSYVHTISTRPSLRKVEIGLSGELYKENRLICSMPSREKLTYYISSISTLADNSVKYISRVVERSVQENSSCYIEFESGKTNIIENLGHNMEEMGRIKENIREILENQLYDLDSVIISAFASPEGLSGENDALALKRAGSATAFFRTYTESVMDSLSAVHAPSGIGFVARNGGENWKMLDRMVATDSLISESDRGRYLKLSEIADLDRREKAMHRLECYRHLRERVYPRLRIVRFDFHLHRRGMLKDTIHTTEVDTAYMKGLEAIKDMEYESALMRLSPYKDYNTAVALIALDRNHSALDILEELEENARINYLKALINSRLGQDREAVKCYLAACASDRTMIFRGNLDPEISTLIHKYNLNNYQN